MNCNYLKKQTVFLAISLIIGKFNLKLKPTLLKTVVKLKFAINMLYINVYGREVQLFGNTDDL